MSALGAAVSNRLAEDARHIVLAGADVGPCGLEEIVAAHPGRVIRCGRGELMAALAAAGLADEGWRPIVLLHGRTLTGRAIATLQALDTDTPRDLIVVVVGGMTEGAPAGAAPSEDAAAQLAAAAAASGLQVLHVPDAG